MGSKKLTIACVFEGDLHSGGGFQAQLSTIIELSKKQKYSLIPFVFSEQNVLLLQNLGFSPVLIKNNIFTKVFRFVLLQKVFFAVVQKFKFKTYFENQVSQYGIDLVYFLAPSKYALDLTQYNYVYTLWDMCHRDMNEFPEVNFNREFELREILYKKVTSKAIATIVESELGAMNLSKRYGIDSNRVYSASLYPSLNTIHSGYIDIKKKYSIDTDYIYYPAQFWAHKNHVYIIDALVVLNLQGIKLTAVFSGSDKGNLTHVLNYAKKTGIENLIKYIGFAPNEELYHLYQQSLALVMPTYFGPTNIPPLEAFSIGTPVIYSDLEGLREQVGDAALLCDLKNPNNLAKHLKNLLESIGLRKDLISKGKNRLKELSKSDIIDILSEIFDDYAIKLKSWDYFI